MPIEFNFDANDKIIFTNGIGIVSLDDLMDYGEKILNLEEDLNGTIEYIDFSEVEDISITYQSAKRMLSVYSRWAQRGVKGSIIYAPAPASYGIARMIGAVLSSVMNVENGGPEIIQSPISRDEIKSYFK